MGTEQTLTFHSTGVMASLKLYSSSLRRLLVIGFIYLKMRAPGDSTSLYPSNPNRLFQAFADITTQLNNTTSSWGLTLAHQFHAALPIEYCEDIKANDVNRYQFPDPATLTTKAKQLAALRTLRWLAVNAKKQLETLFKQQTAFMTTYMQRT
jgi:hypothetical protein